MARSLRCTTDRSCRCRDDHRCFGCVPADLSVSVADAEALMPANIGRLDRQACDLPPDRAQARCCRPAARRGRLASPTKTRAASTRRRSRRHRPHSRCSPGRRTSSSRSAPACCRLPGINSASTRRHRWEPASPRLAADDCQRNRDVCFTPGEPTSSARLVVSAKCH